MKKIINLSKVSTISRNFTEITDTFLAAQASIFFAAGFETSTAAMAHFLYEMALNPSMQDKLRKELKEFHVKNNGNLKYEDIKEMKYFDKVFKGILYLTIKFIFNITIYK